MGMRTGGETRTSAILLGTAAILLGWPGAARADTAAPAPAPASMPAAGGAAALPGAAAPASAPAEVIPGAAEEPSALEKKIDELTAAVTKMKGLHLSGYVQGQLVLAMQGASALDAAGAPTEKDIFSVRRGRLKVTYTGVAWAELMFQIDATTKGFALKDAEASYVSKIGGGTLKLTLGLFKTPVGFEILESSGDRPFMERSRMWGAWIPGERDVGLRVFYDRDLFNVRVAVTNGEPVGEKSFPGLDVNRAKDISGRAGLHLKRFDAGVSGLVGWGWTPPVAARAGSVTWDDLNGDTAVTPDELTGVPPVAAADAFNWPRWLAGVDLGVTVPVPVLGDGVARAEFFYGSNMDRATAFRPSDANESFNQLGFELRYLQSFGKWIVGGARVDYYDPDLSSANDQALTIAPLLMLQRDAFRLVLEYDLVLDKADDGTGTFVEKKDDVFTARFQVKY